MSELDQLLKQDPDFLPLNDWKKDNDTGDEIKNRKNYADYVRGEYVSAGAYSDRIENEISQSTLDSAVADGVIKADDQAAKEMLIPSYSSSRPISILQIRLGTQPRSISHSKN